MRAGQTVLMLFPGDSSPTPVPVKRVAEARASGAWFQKKPLAMRALDVLPEVGGVAGSIGGAAVGAQALVLGPAGVLVPATMGVAGAGMGGAVGQGLREAGYRAMGYGDAPGAIGPESYSQATLQAGGALGGELAMGAGRGLMGVATKVAPRFREGLRLAVEKAGAKNVDQIPEKLSEAHLKLRLPAGEAAVSRAQEQVSRSGIAKSRMVRQLERAGVRISSADILQPLGQLMSNLRRYKATSRADLKFLGKKLDEFLANHGDQMEPEAVDMMKRLHQDLLSGSYGSETTKAARGITDPANFAARMETEWNKVIATGTRRALERAEPAIGVENARSAIWRRIGEANKSIAQKGLTPGQALGMHVLGSGAGLATGSAMGHGGFGTGIGLAATGLAHAASMPQVQSRAALLLTDPAFQAFLRASPQGAKALMDMFSQPDVSRVNQ